MTAFTRPVEDRWFEDYQPGLEAHGGAEHVTAVDIMAFATQFDPQDIHTDATGAAAGPFAGLIASGWHTASLTMRMFATEYLNQNASLASPGVDDLRWLVRVRPGDVLSSHFRVLDARPSASRPDRGIVRTAVEVRNQEGVAVLNMTMTNFIRRKPHRLEREVGGERKPG